MKRREPKQLVRGKAFHKVVQADWNKTAEGKVLIEKTVRKQHGRIGRVDVFVNDDTPYGSIAMVEVKATDWDKMTDQAVKRNIRRQIRQVWDYIETQLVKGEYVPTGEKKSVCPGVIFPKRPMDKNRMLLIEESFLREGMPVVWYDESIEERKVRSTEKP